MQNDFKYTHMLRTKIRLGGLFGLDRSNNMNRRTTFEKYNVTEYINRGPHALSRCRYGKFHQSYEEYSI